VRDGVAVAWLTIDDDDNNVVWFLAHLLESLRRVRPSSGRVVGAGARGARRPRRPLRP
jgi:serine/threonine-protein kinase PknK